MGWSAILLAGCQADPGPAPDTRLDTAGALLPDTQTVAGVLEMRHGADAFERAPQWRLEETADLVIDGGLTFDLTNVLAPTPLPDGRSVALNRIGGGKLMLFDTDGAPVRLLARTGAGPGELMNPGRPSLFGDTIVIADGANQSVNRYTADQGLIDTHRMSVEIHPGCWGLYGFGADGRRLSGYDCYGADTLRRRPNPVAWIPADFSRIDTVLTTGGFEMVSEEIRSGSRSMMIQTPLGLGLRPVLAPWGAGIAVGNGALDRGIDHHDADGRRRGRVIIDRPLLAVTPAMREAIIAAELEQLESRSSEGLRDPEDSRRRIREQQFADSLPAYWLLMAGDDGVLWAVDGITGTHPTWAATVFREDGAIIARVHSEGVGFPVALWGDRVLLRETDADGVVRFGLYRVRQE